MPREPLASGMTSTAGLAWPLSIMAASVVVMSSTLIQSWGAPG